MSATVTTSTPKSFDKERTESLPMPLLLRVKEEPLDEMNSTEEISDQLVQVKQEPNSSNLQDTEIKEKRTYKDCPDCLKFIRDYGEEFSEETIQKRIENCSRHNRDENDGNLTPEGFWDPHIASLRADDKRREVLIDDRFSKRKK